MPFFLQRDLWRFTARNNCAGQATAFSFPAFYAPDSLRWNFGDPGSGSANTATTAAPGHVYAPGTYQVTLTLYYRSGHRQVLQQAVQVLALTALSLGPDTTLCPGQALVLRPRLPAEVVDGASYQWSDGSTADSLLVRAPGEYRVSIRTAAGCTLLASRRVAWLPTAPPRLGADTVVCPADGPLVLRARAVGAGLRYRWSDNSRADTLRVSQPGLYWLETTTAAGCTARDSVWVSHLSAGMALLPPDTAACAETPLVLRPRLPAGASYEWSDGSRRPTLTATASGRYGVRATVGSCTAEASILVRLLPCQSTGFIPNIITPNGDGLNDTFAPLGLPGAWHLTVYNRWGRAVCEARPYRYDWQAEGLTNGLYYYLLQQQAEPHRSVRGYVEVAR